MGLVELDVCRVGSFWRLEGGRGWGICFLAFPSFQRLPAFLGLWPCRATISFSFVVSPLTLTFMPPSFTYKDPSDSRGLTQVIQEKKNLPISRSLNQSHLQNLFLIWKVAHAQVPGMSTCPFSVDGVILLLAIGFFRTLTLAS